VLVLGSSGRCGTRRCTVDVGVSAGLELVDGFSCLGDMLGVDGAAGAAVEARVWVGWSKFRQFVLLLASRNVSLMVRGDCAVVVCEVVCCMGVGSGPWEGGWGGTAADRGGVG